MTSRTHESTPDPRTGVAAALLLLAVIAAAPAAAQAPQVQMPQPTVPEMFTLEGEFVRIAYNNEGFASLGYRMVQEELGKDWALLAVGITVRKGNKDFKLTRGALSLTTPDGKRIPLPTQKDYQAANVQALNMRAQMMNDSINYFPADASLPCAIKFFANLDSAFPLAYDEVDLSYQRVCLGRLYFKVPGGIQVGQHFLNIKLATGELQVPFRTLSREDEKVFRKKWDDIKKQHEAAMKGQ